MSAPPRARSFGDSPVTAGAPTTPGTSLPQSSEASPDPLHSSSVLDPPVLDPDGLESFVDTEQLNKEIAELRVKFPALNFQVLNQYDEENGKEILSRYDNILVTPDFETDKRQLTDILNDIKKAYNAINGAEYPTAQSAMALTFQFYNNILQWIELHNNARIRQENPWQRTPIPPPEPLTPSMRELFSPYRYNRGQTPGRSPTPAAPRGIRTMMRQAGMDMSGNLNAQTATPRGIQRLGRMLTPSNAGALDFSGSDMSISPRGPVAGQGMPKKRARFEKGSEAARAHMASLRALRGKKAKAS